MCSLYHQPHFLLQLNLLEKLYVHSSILSPPIDTSNTTTHTKHYMSFVGCSELSKVA